MGLLLPLIDETLQTTLHGVVWLLKQRIVFCVEAVDSFLRLRECSQTSLHFVVLGWSARYGIV